jgi:hypothetical protein
VITIPVGKESILFCIQTVRSVRGSHAGTTPFIPNLLPCHG